MNSKLLLCLALLWLTVVFATYGKSTVFSVTPKNADRGGQFVFVVTNTAASNGLSFHVIITAKQGEVPADSKGYLCVAKLTESGTASNQKPKPTTQQKATGKNQNLILRPNAWNP